MSARNSLVYLEYSFGANFVWLVWALKPGVAHLAAVCTDENKADKYVETLKENGGISYRDCTMWKERVPLDHAFGWRDSISAMITSKGQS